MLTNVKFWEPWGARLRRSAYHLRQAWLVLWCKCDNFSVTVTYGPLSRIWDTPAEDEAWKDL